MADSRRGTVGHSAERRARKYLEGQGLTLLTSNFSTRHGEIDLVMRDGDCLVFIEVRYRRAGTYATAAQSVDDRKQRKLMLAAMGFTRQYPALANETMRFDVIAIDRQRNGREMLEWLPDAFRVG